MFVSPNPDCVDDCRFRENGGISTLKYYPPIYDKTGRNTNPDRNWHTSEVTCTVCGAQWIKKQVGSDTPTFTKISAEKA
jgi:hypothetical protein